MKTPLTAHDTYVAHTAEIHDKLARQQQPADDYFGHDPNAVRWGRVHDVGRVNQAPDDLLASFEGPAKP